MITLILHENLVADFHEACAIRGRMRFAIFRDILLIFAKIIEDFGIWTTWITNRGSFDATTTAPPVFVVIVEKDMLIFLDTTLGTVFTGANFSNFCLYTRFGKDTLPDFGRFGIFWDAVFFVTNKASDVNFVWIETDNFGEKFEESRNLLLLEIIAKRPVTEHFKNRSVAWITHIFNILQTQAWL